MRLAGAVVLVGALAVSGCGKEAGTGILGPVDSVTSATSDAAAAITTVLAGPAPADTAAPEASGPDADASGSPAPAESGADTTPVPVTTKAPRAAPATRSPWVLPETPDAVLTRAGRLFAKRLPEGRCEPGPAGLGHRHPAVAGSPADPETPDVVEIANTQTAMLAGQGLIAGLELARSDLRTEEWTKGLTGSTTLNDDLVAVPMYGFGRVVAYDQQAWKAAGVTAPEVHDRVHRRSGAGPERRSQHGLFRLLVPRPVPRGSLPDLGGGRRDRRTGTGHVERDDRFR